MSSYYIPKWKRHEAKVEADKNYYGTVGTIIYPN